MSEAPIDALARALAEADAAARAALWPQVEASAQLAWALKARVDAAWTSDPQAVPRLAEVLGELAQRCGDGDAQALAAWSRGIVHLVRAEMEAALAAIEDAAARFTAQGKRHEAARMRVSQLMALAMLGRYEEAIECGVSARDVFVECGDEANAGKIELNLGNLAFRRDQYEAAARHYRAAAARFEAAGDHEHGIMATKNLADTLARRHEFDEAAAMYAGALGLASHYGLAHTAALVEGAIGDLEMLRARYDEAMHYLERSRRSFEALAMPYDLAVAEQYLGDAYLELRLLPEALALYDRSLATYEAAGMQADRAWALAQRGRTLALLRDYETARQSLQSAQRLFADEGNAVGAAFAHLWLAELALAQGDSGAAQRHARAAEGPLLAARHMSGHLNARALLAEALALAGEREAARATAEHARAGAAAVGLPQIERRCDLTLGLLARDADEAEQCFRRAVDSIESQRGTLPGEEFRSAFFGDNLRPYHELARLALARDDAAQAFTWVEQARARSLAEAMQGGDDAAGGDAASSEIAGLRRKLNACYRQLARPHAGEASAQRLHDEARRLEAALLEASRRQSQLNAPDRAHAVAQTALDPAALFDALGEHTALVEYFALDGALHAFVAGAAGVHMQRLDVSEAQVAAAVEQLRFQTDTLRHGPARLQHRLPELQRRALHHLQRLHAWLWAPLVPRLGDRRAIVVPHAELHYLPFEALHDGGCFEIERRELARCPSAQVLLRCLARPARGFDSAIVLGHADARLPFVAREIDAVAASFPAAVVLKGGEARTAVLRAQEASADVLHIACHALFRNDNPRFSALQLADGALTAYDAAQMRLRCQLLALSACETAVAHVLSGNEPIGLTYAFLAAGAPTVLASLWTVQDEAAAGLMARFYEELRAERQPARALRAAQLEMLGTHPHPYFWAAFALHGRW
ncbi:CHAT domain-containing protein [Betaproteobacteria bacterium PRO7]|nr:CHAT domain-containing protein [Betaproteobacteria bacterium PRO7]